MHSSGASRGEARACVWNWSRHRHSGAMPTGPREARPDDRLRIEPGMTVSGLHVIASAANPLFLFAARWIASQSLLSGGASAVRKLDHGLAGRHLLARLVAHHDVDQDPARIRRDLFRFDDAGRLA